MVTGIYRPYAYLLSALLALVSLNAFGAEAYSCFQSQVRVGDSYTGGERQGVLYYLTGGPRADFMDEVQLSWNGNGSSADLRCAEGSPSLCYFGEDSGRIWVHWSHGIPRFVIPQGQIFTGLNDGHQYQMYVAMTQGTQVLRFTRLARRYCDVIFPDAANRSREITIEDSPKY